MPYGRKKTQSGKRNRGTAMTQQGDRSSQNAVDLPDLLLRVDDDHDFLCELIGMFKEEFPRVLQSLQQSVVREDIKNVEVTSHALKGMLSGLSVTRAAAIASQLEQMGRDRKTSGMTETLALLEYEVANLLPELDAYTAQAKP
jgi:HPt (histidine-containing phosphotransfer) domain-containing protein